MPAVPLKVTVPGDEPKFVPEMVTDAPGTAVFGEIELIVGPEPWPLKVVNTLSKVAGARDEVLPLVTASPTYTFVAMLIVWLDPNCVQFTPSADV